MSYGFGREFGGSSYAEDLYYAAVATLVDDGVAAKWARRRDIRAGVRRKQQSEGLRVVATYIGQRSWRSASSDRTSEQSMSTRAFLWRCSWRC